MEAIVENSPELKREETSGYKELNIAGVLMLPRLKDVKFTSHAAKNHFFHSQHAKFDPNAVIKENVKDVNHHVKNVL